MFCITSMFALKSENVHNSPNKDSICLTSLLNLLSNIISHYLQTLETAVSCDALLESVFFFCLNLFVICSLVFFSQGQMQKSKHLNTVLGLNIMTKSV